MNKQEAASLVAVFAQLSEQDRKEVFALIQRLSVEGRARDAQPHDDPQRTSPS